MIRKGWETTKRVAARCVQSFNKTCFGVWDFSKKSLQHGWEKCCNRSTLLSSKACALYLVAAVIGGAVYYHNTHQEAPAVEGNGSQQVLETLRTELENRLTATEAYVQQLEAKIAEQGSAKAKRSAPLQAQNEAGDGAVDQIIKQEVAQQIGELRNEVKEQEQKQKRKAVLQRFLEQIATDDD